MRLVAPGPLGGHDRSHALIGQVIDGLTVEFVTPYTTLFRERHMLRLVGTNADGSSGHRDVRDTY